MKFLLDHDVPDDLSYLLVQLGHEVLLLRHVLPGNSSDEAVLCFAHDEGCILLTCNRDDFLHLAAKHSHHALFRLLERAGDTGLRNNINFA